jgi:nicotinamidase-related amidase
MNETVPAIDRQRAMLLLMDYQRAILNNLPGADELLPRVVQAIAAARGRGVRIGSVRVAFSEADYDALLLAAE